jgi:hypothetical protein
MRIVDFGPLIAACMACGDKTPVEPDTSLAAKHGWHYEFDDGWLCPKCSRLDLSHTQLRRLPPQSGPRPRRGPGHPLKGDNGAHPH